MHDDDSNDRLQVRNRLRGTLGAETITAVYFGILLGVISGQTKAEFIRRSGGCHPGYLHAILNEVI